MPNTELSRGGLSAKYFEWVRNRTRIAKAQAQAYQPLSGLVGPAAFLPARNDKSGFNERLEVSTRDNDGYIGLPPIALVPDSEADGGVAERNSPTIGEPAALELVFDSRSDSSDEVEPALCGSGLPVVGSEAKPNPWERIVLRIPGPLPNFGEYMVVGLHVASEVFLYARERGIQDSATSEH